MKRFSLLLFTNIVIPFFSLPPAHAFYGPGRLVVTPTAGMYVFDRTSNTKNSSTVGVKADYGYMSGGAGDLCLDGSVNAAQLHSKTDSSSANAYMVSLGPLFAFPNIWSVTPLLTAGIGGMFSPGAGNSIAGSKAFLTFGLGASALLSRRMAVRVELSRLLVLDLNASNGFEMTIGLSYAFGGKGKPTALAENTPGQPAESDAGSAKVPEAIAVKKGAPLNMLSAPVAEKQAKQEAPAAETGVEIAHVPAVVSGKPSAVQPPGDAKSGPASLMKELLAFGNEPSLKGLGNVKLVETIQFALNKSTVDSSHHGQLQKIAALLKTDPQLRVRIAAHTDNMGNAHANYLFSRKRAQGIKNYLIDVLRIDPERIAAKGYGHYQPVAENATVEGRRENRRAVLIVLTPPAGE